MRQDLLTKMEEMLVRLGGTYILNHAKRVLHISRLIAEKENLAYNDDVLTFAAYFHDVSAFPPYRPNGAFDHALESGKVAPEIAGDFEYTDNEVEIIVEAIQFHDKANMGKHVEARLIHSADGVDYLGYMAVARDFSKFPYDFGKALTALKRREEQFLTIIDLPCAKELAAPRVVELEHFIRRFEEECYGIF